MFDLLKTDSSSAARLGRLSTSRGTIDTPANRRAMPDADASRWISPADIAQVILFLASDDSNVVSGAAVPVYGRA